ncbi:secondary thiamine-phosphate synthase enzyme YjbQ [Pendulispora brunnea]|uniref:Secondary thiamine-phosphate synthase enzyme YjbQ n=1 Tax=Pendulispora brunnea TaxID=2905690 RepID=A0ABZ2KHS4_9BACT
MKILNDVLNVRTDGRGFYDVTREVARIVAGAQVTNGLCTVFVQHTSASLVIQENADPAVLRDLEKWMSRLAPESAHYEHDDEGPDDMPAHLRGAITKTSESIPIAQGKLVLGTWQAIYLWEHRARAHARRIVVNVVGE